MNKQVPFKYDSIIISYIIYSFSIIHETSLRNKKIVLQVCISQNSEHNLE